MICGDCGEWAPFITKLALVHNLSWRWTLSASAVHYSGFPGAQDYARYAETFAVPPSAVPVSDPGYSEPYGPNLYVNAGLEFRPSPHWTLRLDAYNLAALADEKLSKRNYYFRLSEFSVQPTSLAFSARYRFYWRGKFSFYCWIAAGLNIGPLPRPPSSHGYSTFKSRQSAFPAVRFGTRTR